MTRKMSYDLRGDDDHKHFTPCTPGQRIRSLNTVHIFILEIPYKLLQRQCFEGCLSTR